MKRNALFILLALAVSLAGAAPLTASAMTLAPSGTIINCTATYVVKTGDTLSKIGLAYNVPWTAIAQANGLTSPYPLNPEWPRM